MNQSTVHHTIFSDLFRSPSANEKRMIDIVEAAIENYATIGVEKTTYERIAKTCKVSRPLIVHYFKDKEEIFNLSIRYIRANYQRMVVEQMKGKSQFKDLFKSYIESSLAWPDHFPSHLSVWLLFYYRSSIDPEYKKMNTELVKMGHDRITAILETGKKEGVVSCSKLSQRAKEIQIVISGAIFSEHFEELSISTKEYRKRVLQQCLKIIDLS